MYLDQAKKQELPLTLSIGVSYGDDNHQQIGQVALQNLNTALYLKKLQESAKEKVEKIKGLL